jgi:N-acyl-L-homoserine lactone synthetase
MIYRIFAFSLADSHKYGNILEQMLRLRYKGFIVEEKYEVSNYSGLEFDQYDNPHAKYLLILKGGQAVACARLNRTDFTYNIGGSDVSYMAKDLWGKQIPNNYLLSNSNTYELTRLYVDSSLETKERAVMTRLIVGALYVYSVSLKVSKWLFVTHQSLLNVASKIGMTIPFAISVAVQNFPNQKFACVDIQHENLDLIMKNVYDSTGFNLMPFVYECNIISNDTQNIA